MFKFFTTRKWFVWAYIGSAVILSSIWLQVQIDVKINEWFGEFYDMIQKALGTPNAITMSEYMGSLFAFAQFAALWIVLGLATSFLTSHFYLDGELLWLIGTIAYMTKLVQLKVQVKGYKKTL